MKDSEKLEKLVEICRFHQERMNRLREFKKTYLDNPKLTKEYYLNLKKMIYTDIKDIQREIQLLEELGDIIYETNEDLPEEYQFMLEELHCTKADAFNAARLIENLQSDIDRNLDIINKTNETVRFIQERTLHLSPSHLNMLFMDPNLNMDISVLEIEL